MQHRQSITFRCNSVMIDLNISAHVFVVYCPPARIVFDLCPFTHPIVALCIVPLCPVAFLYVYNSRFPCLINQFSPLFSKSPFDIRVKRRSVQSHPSRFPITVCTPCHRIAPTPILFLLPRLRPSLRVDISYSHKTLHLEPTAREVSRHPFDFISLSLDFISLSSQKKNKTKQNKTKPY